MNYVIERNLSLGFQRGTEMETVDGFCNRSEYTLRGSKVLVLFVCRWNGNRRLSREQVLDIWSIVHPLQYVHHLVDQTILFFTNQNDG